tara:strand:+ start:501 stop:1043 length:543 start_codon:yes stop_codon:yes gene_type:complete
MKLDVIRFQYGKDATNSLLFIDDEFEAYGLEDEHRDVKVMHETCIPEGTYKIKLRTVGGFHTKYAAKYGDWHKGMLWVQDVPGFEFILLHTGNTDQHTSGCYIIGETQQDLDKGKDGFVGSSGVAYKKMYPKVADAILQGEDVEITYTNVKDLLEAPEKISDLNGQLIAAKAANQGRTIN